LEKLSNENKEVPILWNTVYMYNNKKMPYKKLSNAVLEPQPFNLPADRYSLAVYNIFFYLLVKMSTKTWIQSKLHTVYSFAKFWVVWKK